MVRRGIPLFILAACLAAPWTGAGAQEEGTEPPPGMPPMGAPPQMKTLEQYNGVWNVEFKFRMDPSSEDWSTTHALATCKMILDGVAQLQEFSGEMMGMKFTGRGWTCYDRDTKKWQNSWVDNFGAKVSLYEGEMTDKGLVFSGMDKMQGMDVYSRTTTTPVTDDTFTWTMETSMDGENYTVSGTAVYTRRQ
jgi:hypothetical protein